MLPRDLRDSIGDLVKGTVPLELGLQAPGMGTAGRDLRSRCRRRRGSRPRRVCRRRGGARRRFGQADGNFSFVFALPGDDERDAVGKRLPAGTVAAV
jgi:hypothetical protein